MRGAGLFVFGGMLGPFWEDSLTTGLQHAYLKYLSDLWWQNNQAYLQGRLQPPVFVLFEGKGKLGFWQKSTRSLGLNLNFLITSASHQVMDVLKHEMAHQYADEVLEAARHGESRPHGSAFAHACRLLDVASNARYRPEQGQKDVFEKIKKLLALAESSNVHEAEAAMAGARRLMEKYEVGEGLHDHSFCYLYLGGVHKRKDLVRQLIASVLTRFFHVELLWVPSSQPVTQKRVWLLEAMGTQTQLKVADYVYCFIERELNYLWLAHRGRRPALKGATPKREFQVGVLQGLADKLEAEQVSEGQEPVSAPSPESSRLMILKEEELGRFIKQRHPNVRSGRRLTYRETENYRAGFEQGKKMEIRSGVGAGKGGMKRLKA